MGFTTAIICIVAALAIGGAVGVFLGIQLRKKTAEKEIGSAEEEAKKIVADAIKTAEAKKKEFVLEGKDEVHRFRNESEKEISDRRKEVQRRNAVSSKRKKLSTVSSITWKKRTRSFPKS